MRGNKRRGRVSRRGAVRMAAGASLTGALFGRRPSDAKATAAPEQEIVGSWIQLIEGQAVRAVQTFTADGGFVGTTAQHLDRSPSHGAWVRTGDRTFLVTMQDMTVSIEQRNTLVATSKVRLEITVEEDGQHYTSRGIREDFDLSETLLRTERTTGRGTRIIPEPLD